MGHTPINNKKSPPPTKLPTRGSSVHKPMAITSSPPPRPQMSLPRKDAPRTKPEPAPVIVKYEYKPIRLPWFDEENPLPTRASWPTEEEVRVSSDRQVVEFKCMPVIMHPWRPTPPPIRVIKEGKSSSIFVVIWNFITRRKGVGPVSTIVPWPTKVETKSKEELWNIMEAELEIKFSLDGKDYSYKSPEQRNYIWNGEWVENKIFWNDMQDGDK